uniref:Uncharacterized protein n=1 Tax=Helianthus annuus TaxID=4232 RepID=A0A251S052_HELAN
MKKIIAGIALPVSPLLTSHHHRSNFHRSIIITYIDFDWPLNWTTQGRLSKTLDGLSSSRNGDFT